MTALTKLSTDYTSSDQAKELVDRLLSNLFPFKSYNPSDETQSPLPVYCNPETRMNAVDLLEAMVYQNPKLFPQIAVVLRQNHPVLPGNITNKQINSSNDKIAIVPRSYPWFEILRVCIMYARLK